MQNARGSATERPVSPAAGTQVPQTLQVRMEEDAVDTAARDGEQQRRERLVLVVEDERRLTVELVHFGLQILDRRAVAATNAAILPAPVSGAGRLRIPPTRRPSGPPSVTITASSASIATSASMFPADAASVNASSRRR